MIKEIKCNKLKVHQPDNTVDDDDWLKPKREKEKKNVCMRYMLRRFWSQMCLAAIVTPYNLLNTHIHIHVHTFSNIHGRQLREDRDINCTQAIINQRSDKKYLWHKYQLNSPPANTSN